MIYQTTVFLIYYLIIYQNSVNNTERYNLLYVYIYLDINHFGTGLTLIFTSLIKFIQKLWFDIYTVENTYNED